MKFLLVFLIIRQEGPNEQDFGSATFDPLWLKNAMAFNEDHANRHQQRMVTHDIPPLAYLPFQINWCITQTGQPESSDETKKCLARFNRDNNTWKKFDVLYQHLLANDAEYVLFMDVDSVIAHPQVDTLQKMADELEETGKDLMLADEDWRPYGNSTINTGVMLAKNTEWTKMFLKELIGFRTEEKCQKNEQLCLNGQYKSNRFDAKDHLYVASGSRWNRHPRLDPFAPEAEITHFMGGGKNGLNSIDMFNCGHCPCLHGTCVPTPGAKGACLDVPHCASLNTKTGLKHAFVVTDDLLNSYESSERVALPNALEDIKAVAVANNADVVLIVPDKFGTFYPLTETERAMLKDNGIVVHEAISWRSADSGLEESKRAHAERKIWFYERPKKHWLVLQSLGLVEYHSVVFVDRSIRIEGNFSDVFRCAARNRFLGSAGFGFPLNSQLFAVHPDMALFESAVHYAAHANYSDAEGWSGGGWWPAMSSPLRMLDGFFWTFFFSNGRTTATNAVTQALAEFDIEPVKAFQIDPSLWRGKQDGVTMARKLKRPGCDGKIFAERLVV